MNLSKDIKHPHPPLINFLLNTQANMIVTENKGSLHLKQMPKWKNFVTPGILTMIYHVLLTLQVLVFVFSLKIQYKRDAVIESHHSTWNSFLAISDSQFPHHALSLHHFSFFSPFLTRTAFPLPLLHLRSTPSIPSPDIVCKSTCSSIVFFLPPRVNLLCHIKYTHAIGCIPADGSQHTHTHIYRHYYTTTHTNANI